MLGDNMKETIYVAVYQERRYQVRILNEVLEDVKNGLIQEDNMLLTFKLKGNIEEKKLKVEAILNGENDGSI